MTAYPEALEFLGHTVSYWLDLQRRLDESDPQVPKLLDEILSLNGRLRYYEERIRQMAEVMKS